MGCGFWLIDENVWRKNILFLIFEVYQVEKSKIINWETVGYFNKEIKRKL